MFCKFCGETIDRRTMKCPSCGKSVGPLAGGVGFWDLAGQPAPVAPVAPAVNPGEMEQLQGRNPVNHKNGKQPAAKKLPILSLVAILLALVLLVMIIMMRGDIRALEQKFGELEQKNGELVQKYEELEQINAELEQKYEEVSGEPSWFEQLLDDTVGKNDEKNDEKNDPQDEKEVPVDPADPTAPGSEGYPDWIIKQPKEEKLTTEQIVSGASVTLFTLEVAKENLTFCWEKYDTESKEWIKVDEDHYKVDQKPIPDGVSAILMLKVCSEEACGKYHCRIVDENGKEYLSEDAFVTLDK